MSSSNKNSSVSKTGEHIGSTQRPTAKYNPISDSLRNLTSGPLQCSMFCGGKGCKYDNPSKWSDAEMAIKGLYSSWVTNKILAMSRPSTDAIKKYDIIDQFKQHGIKAVINLQTAGEHAGCGNGLEPGGFSYNPQEFMDNGIYFYNFGWDDYGVRSLTFLLDMVKVMSFAVKEGKVAVHCHAGLGRTGVLIACYLIFAKRFDGDHAVHFVREKRPGAIQTKGQVECCQQFAQFLIPLRVVFASWDPCSYPFTLEQYLNRQKHILHGYEARELKHIPKIIKVVCVRLHQLAKIRDVHSSMSLNKQDSLDVVTKSIPGAFQETRHPKSNSKDRDASHESLQRRRSNSLEQLTTDRLSPNSADNDSRVPTGRRSPNLDLCKMRINDRGSTVSSSEDDFGPVGRSKRPTQSRDVPSHSSSGHGGVLRMRTSLSLLSHISDESRPDQADVEMVAAAMAYDMRQASNGVHNDDEDEGVVREDDGVMYAMQNLKERVESLQHNLNQSQSAWKIVATEEDPFVLAALMWSWLEHLKDPVLQEEDVDKLLDEMNDPLNALKNMPKHQRYTVDCLLRTAAGLRPLPDHAERPMLRRLVTSITQGEDNTRFVKFVQKCISAIRAALPQQRLSDTNSKQTEPIEKPKEGKKKAKLKKIDMGAKSPRRPRKVENHQDRNADSGSSEDEKPKSLPVPKKRANALPPIF